MPLVTVTRLRLRSGRFTLPFYWHALRSYFQSRRAAGYIAGILRNADGANWTLTVWQDTAAMRAFMLSGAHRQAMPHLTTWCDEASLADWEQTSPELPTWDEAVRVLGASGRISRVAFPSPAQAGGDTLGSSRAVLLNKKPAERAGF